MCVFTCVRIGPFSLQYVRHSRECVCVCSRAHASDLCLYSMYVTAVNVCVLTCVRIGPLSLQYARHSRECVCVFMCVRIGPLSLQYVRHTRECVCVCSCAYASDLSFCSLFPRLQANSNLLCSGTPHELGDMHVCALDLSFCSLFHVSVGKLLVYSVAAHHLSWGTCMCAHWTSDSILSFCVCRQTLGVFCSGTPLELGDMHVCALNLSFCSLFHAFAGKLLVYSVAAQDLGGQPPPPGGQPTRLLAQMAIEVCVRMFVYVQMFVCTHSHKCVCTHTHIHTQILIPIAALQEIVHAATWVGDCVILAHE